MTLVKPRGDGDCGLTALAALLSERRVSYDAVSRVASDIHPYAAIIGLYNREVIALAQRFGLELAQARKYDLDRDYGVLRLYAPHLWPGGHFVAVRDGLLWDSLETDAAPWRVYQRRRRARFGTLLRVC